MSRSSARGQTEPLAALAAVAAACLALSLYAGVVTDAIGEPPEGTDGTALDRAYRLLASGGVVAPPLDVLDTATGFSRANVTLAAGPGRWSHGPVPPDGATPDSRRVSVRLGPGRVRPGLLRVVVW